MQAELTSATNPSTASPELTTSIDTRRHDLDALRAIAMLLGIGLHAALSFIPNIGEGWAVQDARPHESFAWFMSAIHGFRMPLFFLLSGFFTAMLWRKRGLKALVVHRFKRIFLPLLLGMVTIVPAVWGAIFLVQAKKTPDAISTIWDAAGAGDVEAISEFLEDGVDINGIGNGGHSPLSWAALLGQVEAAEFLLDNGANIDQRVDRGSTPLHLTGIFGQADVAKLLLDRGANPKIRNNDGAFAMDVTKIDPGVSRWVAGLVGYEYDEATVSAGQEKCRTLLMEKLALTEDSGEEMSTSQGEQAASDTERLGQLAGFLFFLAFFIPVFHHLWFLYFLCWLVLAFAVYAKVMHWLGWSSVPTWLVKSPTCWLWVLPLSMLGQATMGWMYPNFGPDTSVGLIPMPNLLFYYAIFFFFGAFYFDSNDEAGAFGRYWAITLPIALLLVFPLGYALVMSKFGVTDYLSQGVARITAILLQVVYTWMMCVGSMGLFRALFSAKNQSMRFVSDSSYWLYLAHMPLVIVLQAWLRDWPVAAWLKFTVICAIATCLLLLSYRYCIRYTPIGTLLNGPRTRPGQVAAPKPSAA